MTRSGNQTHTTETKRKHPDMDSDLPSSFGDSPVEVTPKDVSPDDATARDTQERDISSCSAEEREDAILDEAVELTFPASDPIAPSSVTKIVPKGKDKEEKGKK